MSVTGESGVSRASHSVYLADMPIVDQADLSNPNSAINDSSRSGKQAGAMVYARLSSGDVTIAVASGNLPTDTWSLNAEESVLPIPPVRKKMEVNYTGLSLLINNTGVNLVSAVNALVPTSGSLNSFFNTSSNKLNVYNDDATLFMKVNVAGSWSSSSNNPDSLQMFFSGPTGNVVKAHKSYRPNGSTNDTLHFVTYLSVDKNGFIASNGSTITLSSLDRSFTITSIFITLEQYTAVASIVPV